MEKKTLTENIATNFKLGRHKRGRQGEENEEEKNKICKLTDPSAPQSQSHSPSSSPSPSNPNPSTPSKSTSTLSPHAAEFKPGAGRSNNPPTLSPSASSGSNNPPPEPPQLPKPPIQKQGVQFDPDAHLTIAFSLQKAMLKKWILDGAIGLDIGSATDLVSIHGLFGDGIKLVGGGSGTGSGTGTTQGGSGSGSGTSGSGSGSGTTQGGGRVFVTNFGDIEGARDLTIQLLGCWRSIQVKNPQVSFVDHFETPWKETYQKHSQEVLMDQEDYFRYTLSVFDVLAPLINRALKDSCKQMQSDTPNCEGSYWRDGRRELDVQLFLTKLVDARLPHPTLHVNRVGGGHIPIEQELVELRFYIDPNSGELINTPTSKNTPNSKKRYKLSQPLFLV